MPLKAQIIQHLDEITEAAKFTGAVNTIVKIRSEEAGVSKTRLVGTNTDLLGG